MAIFRVEVDGNVNASMKFRKIPEKIQDNAVKELKSVALPKIVAQVKRGIPLGIKDNKLHGHARTSDSIKGVVRSNMRGFKNFGLYVYPKKDFWYIKFPNNGTGSSKGKAPLHFVQKAVYQNTNLVKSILSKASKGVI